MSQPHNLPELPTQAESETRMAPDVAAAVAVVRAYRLPDEAEILAKLGIEVP